MTKFIRTFFAATAAALLIAAGAVPTEAAPRVSAFDGDWSVVIHTIKGDCGEALRYRVHIIGSRVVSDSDNYKVGGAVKATGGIYVRVAEGGSWASGTGILKGNFGRGQWHTGKGECHGHWTAERRDAGF
jgi:hypothetical protein